MIAVVRAWSGWWRRRVEEIDSSSTLRIYGACLAAIHLLTFMYWSSGGFAVRILSDRSPVCWPFFEECSAAHGASRHTVQLLLWCYGIAAAATTFVFARQSIGNRSASGALA